MQAKNVLYAAVGAPVVAARKVTDQVNELRGRVSKETASYSEAANKAIDGWAAEGEKVVSRISEGKVVEEISQKVDLDQAKEQVGKLRDQLEDMLATWRSSFRPEKAADVAKAHADQTEPADKTAAKPAAKKSPAKRPANKTSAAKTSTAKSGSTASAAKTSTAKSGSKTKAS
ncbi:MAG TPA: hypothetical protein VEB69_11870 [Acidimicrobiia bacterium]|nr:hypothetical protein [Acidimicrobiia bacterium]